MNFFRKYKVLVAVFFFVNIFLINWLLDIVYDVKGFGRITLSENDFQELIAFSMMGAFSFAVFMNLFVEIFIFKSRSIRRIAGDEVDAGDDGETHGAMALVKAYSVYIFAAVVCTFMIFHTVGAF